MGTLHYGGAAEIEIEDRLLAHLQIVIGAKLRRGESFFYSWKDAPGAGDGRNSVWIDTSGELSFSYDSASPPAINREWLELLTISANSAQGLQWIEEPTAT